jgi:hypothetical protein
MIAETTQNRALAILYLVSRFVIEITGWSQCHF